MGSRAAASAAAAGGGAGGAAQHETAEVAAQRVPNARGGGEREVGEGAAARAEDFCRQSLKFFYKNHWTFHTISDPDAIFVEIGCFHGFGSRNV